MTKPETPLTTKPLATRLAAMLALNHAVYTEHDLDVLIHRLLGMVCEVIGAEAASLALVDHDRDELVFQFAVGTAGDQVERFRLPLGQGVVGWVAQQAVAVRLDTAAGDPSFSARLDQSTGFQTRSLLAVPLLREGRVLGVLEGLNKREGSFTAEDETLCSLLANTVAVSLENYQLHRLYRQRLASAPLPEVLPPDEQVLMAVQQRLASGKPFAGDLAEHPLPAILRVLADSQVSGALTVVHGAAEVGLVFVEGELVDAWLPARKLVGSQAALEALTWTSGRYALQPGVRQGARTVTEPLWLLLARGQARQRILQDWAARLPDDRYLQPRAHETLPDSPAAGILWPMLPATVGEVLGRAPLDRISTYEALASMLSAGSLG